MEMYELEIKNALERIAKALEKIAADVKEENRPQIQGFKGKE